MMDNINLAVGQAVKSLRQQKKLSAVQLAAHCGVSTSMISRIETGQVSASLSSLTAIAQALDMPLISLFKNTMELADITHTTPANRQNSTRYADRHKHLFSLLGQYRSDTLNFETNIMTLSQSETGNIPIYTGDGVEFVYVLEGEALYQYCQDEFHLKKDHSLTFNATIGHGFKQILTPQIKFICVSASS